MLISVFIDMYWFETGVPLSNVLTDLADKQRGIKVYPNLFYILKMPHLDKLISDTTVWSGSINQCIASINFKSLESPCPFLPFFTFKEALSLCFEHV